MYSLLRIVLLSVVFIQISGCASDAGIKEFTLYKESFEASRTAADSLFDKVAVAERENFARTTAGQNTTRDFAISEVPYIAPSSEPPVARAYRRAFGTIAEFNAVVLGLALGRPANALVDEISTLGTESLGLAGALTTSGNAALASLIPYKQFAENLARIALTAQARETFRAELMREGPRVRELMETLRDGAPVLFQFLVASAKAESDNARAGLPGASATAFAERAQEVRPLLADWVLLMDSNIAALAAAESAATSEHPQLKLASARALLFDARLSAEALRKGVAALPGS